MPDYLQYQLISEYMPQCQIYLPTEFFAEIFTTQEGE